MKPNVIQLMMELNEMVQGGRLASWEILHLDFESGMADVKLRPVKPVEYIQFNVVITKEGVVIEK